MADEDRDGGGEGDGGGSPVDPGPPKCPECVPGLPGWMGTFSDLVTLLLTFFVLLLSFAKTETAKYEAALGSIRNAFGGNVLKHGEVIQRGKSPDDSPTMLESSQVIRPFPIEFLTMEGLLNKHEVNRESDEELAQMRQDLYDYNLTNHVTIEEMPEGIKVRTKEHIYFKKGDVKLAGISREVFDRMTDLLRSTKWKVFVEGHSSKGEVSLDGQSDAFDLSARRAMVVSRVLVKRGVRPAQITTLFYGDSRPDEVYENSTATPDRYNRRVEFTLRKRDLRDEGHYVRSQ